jgi:hypothetical protein
MIKARDNRRPKDPIARSNHLSARSNGSAGSTWSDDLNLLNVLNYSNASSVSIVH